MRRPRITYANAMATVALVAALSGTAAAATLLTGASVADNSITGADVKTGSLATPDLSKRARETMRGEPGATGPAGSKGSAGLQGANGADGPRGSAALMTSAFAYRDTGLTTQRTNSLTPNNGPGNTGHDWDSPSYASDASGGPYPNIRTSGNYQSIPLTAAWTPVLALTGMTGSDPSRSVDSLLKVTFANGTLNATGTLTLLHRADGENLATNSGGTLRHGRVQCAIFAGTSADPAQLATRAGVEGWASSGVDGLAHELVQVSVNGSRAGVVAGGQYNVAVKCRDADYTGNAQWQLASGNLTALVSQ